jgi:hypothetical protein
MSTLVSGMVTSDKCLSVSASQVEESLSESERSRKWDLITDNYSIASSLATSCTSLIAGELTYELSEILRFVERVERCVWSLEVEWFERGYKCPITLMSSYRLAARQVIAESYWRDTPRAKLYEMCCLLGQRLDEPDVERHKCIDVACYAANTLSYLLANEAY